MNPAATRGRTPRAGALRARVRSAGSPARPGTGGRRSGGRMSGPRREPATIERRRWSRSLQATRRRSTSRCPSAGPWRRRAAPPKSGFGLTRQRPRARADASALHQTPARRSGAESRPLLDVHRIGDQVIRPPDRSGHPVPKRRPPRWMLHAPDLAPSARGSRGPISPIRPTSTSRPLAGRSRRDRRPDSGAQRSRRRATSGRRRRLESVIRLLGPGRRGGGPGRRPPRLRLRRRRGPGPA